ncbi:MAG: hypothetical protein DRH90_25340 [Deltaproteobacteria bacterium]|nr:MAG: hypothetical protein DRH90_25340 [Deltaproteobacteria bacterium]
MDEEQLFAALVKAGKMEEAHQVRLSLDRRTTGSLGERGELVARAKQLGMDSSDLFVPEEPWKNKFAADMGALFTRQGLGINQAYQHLRGGDTQNIDERVAAEQRNYESTGLADEFTGGQLAGGLVEGLGGGYLARTALASSPYLTGSALGAAEMAPEPVIGPQGQAVRGNEYITGKARQLGTGAAFGVGGEAIPMGAIRSAEIARNAPGAPYRTLAEPSKKESGGMFRGSPAEQAEMQALRDKSGIDFTPGQMAGDGGLRQIEELARTNIFTRDAVQASDVGRIGQLNTYIKEFRDSLGESAPIEVIAPKMQAFGRDVANKLKTRRRLQADQDYRVVQSYADGSPVIGADNYRDVLVDIIKKGDGTGAGPAARSAAAEAKSRLARLKKQGGSLTGTDVDNLTRAEGFIGGDSPFNKTNADTVNQSVIRDAVERDIAEYPDLSEALNTAKANYRRNSDTINEFEVNLLGQVIGKEFASDLTGAVSGTMTPEKVFKRFTAAGTSPTEVKAAFAHIDRIDPELSNQFRASIVERAREASKIKPAAAGQATGDIDPGTFLRNLGISGGERGMQGLERLAAIFPGDPEFLGSVRRAATILADKSLVNTSKTETQGAAREAMEAATGLLVGAFSKLGHLVGGAGAMQYVARRMANPELATDALRLNRPRRVVSGARPATIPAFNELARELERE